ncbi:5-(carboxyamino)imidazole ribonucleotide synthase [Parvibaculaceae bacterium PLY_AMNH_Bact1]|nr:5-(carboxyamino)imidazole ribonucleotide synthase [Parvibaculaceae bacterium PLY_AMNH_Bact1]
MVDQGTAAALPPGSTIGILGGGQLGRMLALAAAELGLRVHIYAPEETSPAAEVASSATRAAYEDETALIAFADAVDVVTYEFENVPSETARILSEHAPVRPGPKALATSQDRLDEKNFLNSLGIATAPFAQVDTLGDLKSALDKLGTPAVLKTRRFGYDGKGQIKINDPSEASAAFDAIAGAPAILEGFMPFEKEVSVIAARALDGTSAAYDVGENVHRDHILHTTTVPAVLDASIADEARTIAECIAHGLDYVGVIGVEFFVLVDGEKRHLCVNEFAPRVHNSGHWTADACAVSQFEQHVRAIAGWPLGNPARHSDAVMTNLIGAEADEWIDHAAVPHCAVHLYGKREARPGRKMGHVTNLTRSFTKTD